MKVQTLILFITLICITLYNNDNIFVNAKKKKQKKAPFSGGNKAQMIFINLREGYEGSKVAGGIK